MSWKLIAGPQGPYHVANDIVTEFESAIQSDNRIQTVRPAGRYASRAAYVAGKLSPIRALARTLRQGNYFAVMMGLNVFKCSPFFFRSGKKMVYLFDAWPDDYKRIQEFVTLFQVNTGFVSSSISAKRLSDTGLACKFVWIPEGVDPASYRCLPWKEKDIDVLQMGRKYDAHHQQIVEPLQKAGRTYVFEKTKGQVVFPSRNEFVNGLARSKISICVPSSITHPVRSGDVTTMTTRYLQSMASRCLVLGHAPPEMTELFGYNPVVEIDNSDPAGQIQSLLADHSKYEPLIEKNYAEVVANHTWLHRWRQIAQHLFAAQ